jgi:hypothetical protein
MKRKLRMIFRYPAVWRFKFVLRFPGRRDWGPKWSAVVGLAIAVLKC